MENGRCHYSIPSFGFYCRQYFTGMDGREPRNSAEEEETTFIIQKF